MCPCVSFYVEDFRELKEETTRKLFFWQALELLSSGKLGCSSDEAIELAAIALQVQGARGAVAGEAAWRGFFFLTLATVCFLLGLSVGFSTRLCHTDVLATPQGTQPLAAPVEYSHSPRQPILSCASGVPLPS